MARIGKLNVEIGATNKTKRGLTAAGSDIRKWAKRIRKDNALDLDIGSILSRGYGAAPAALAKGAAAGVAALGAAAGATALAVKSGADQIDNLADASKRLLGNNGATGALAGLRFAAEEAGVEAGVLDKGMEKMLDTISKGARGDKAAVDAIERIGLSAQDLHRMRPEAQIVAIADAIGEVQNQADKVSLGRGIFGRAGAGLVTLFDEGGDAIRDATRDMDLFGQSINAVDAEKVGTMNDELGRLGKAWEGTLMQLSVEFAPLVTEWSSYILTMIEDAGGVGSAVDHAFEWGINKASEFLDALESVRIGWGKLDEKINKGASMLGKGIAWLEEKSGVSEWAAKNEKEKRLAMVAPEKRAEFERLLDESGGFQRDSVTTKGLVDEFDKSAADAEARVNDIEQRRRDGQSLGDRFKAWAHNAQAKGAANAAEKLNTIADDRLETEDAITKEIEKQTKEKKEQLRLELGGQGKFAHIAFNGVGLTPEGKAKAASSEEEDDPKKSKGAITKAASESSPITRVASEPGVVTQTIAENYPAPPPMLARTAPQQAPAEFGSKGYWDSVLFGGGESAGYKSKIPQGEPNWKSKIPTGAAKYESKRPVPDFLSREGGGYRDKVPTDVPDYVNKMSPDMQAALAANPMKNNNGENNAKLDRIAQLLEQIAGNTKSPTMGLT